MAIKEKKKKKGIYDGLPYFMAIKEKKKKGSLRTCTAFANRERSSRNA
jgi:hypothetical protein